MHTFLPIELESLNLSSFWKTTKMLKIKYFFTFCFRPQGLLLFFVAYWKTWGQRERERDKEFLVGVTRHSFRITIGAARCNSNASLRGPGTLATLKFWQYKKDQAFNLKKKTHFYRKSLQITSCNNFYERRYFLHRMAAERIALYIV